MDRFLTMSSEAVASGSAEEKLRNEMRLDFFLPVLDTFLMSLRSRFNSECTKVLKLISSVVQCGDNFNESVRQLASLTQLNADLCVAEGNVLMKNKDYRPSEDETASDPPPTLQRITSKMVTSGHSAVYRNFYALAVFLLTLPVTSASCERAHSSKVDLVKSAVRASMGSERLEHLVLISAEKSVLDSIKMSGVVNKFAVHKRGLPL